MPSTKKHIFKECCVFYLLQYTSNLIICAVKKTILYFLKVLVLVMRQILFKQSDDL